MPLLNEEIRREVAKFLEGIPRPVRLVMFTQEFECEYCADTRQLVEELAEDLRPHRC